MNKNEGSIYLQKNLVELWHRLHQEVVLTQSGNFQVYGQWYDWQTEGHFEKDSLKILASSIFNQKQKEMQPKFLEATSLPLVEVRIWFISRKKQLNFDIDGIYKDKGNNVIDELDAIRTRVNSRFLLLQ